MRAMASPIGKFCRPHSVTEPDLKWIRRNIAPLVILACNGSFSHASGARARL